MSRDASTVWTRWLATVRSIVATPVMSMTTTVARLSRIAAEQLLGELAGARGVQDADDRQDQQAVAELQHRRRELPHRLLLLVDDPLALLDEAHPDGHRDAVRRRLVGVEDAIEQLEVVLVLREQRPRQDVAQEEHDPEHLVGLDAARDDPLGELARVGLEVLDAAGLERVDVVVEDLGRLGEDLLVRHDAAAAPPR